MNVKCSIFSQQIVITLHLYLPIRAIALRNCPFIRRGCTQRGVRPIMTYTVRLHPKGVSFSGCRYMKG